MGAVATTLLLGAGTLHAQANQAQALPPRVDTLVGEISATLPSGAELRGAGATVYIWADQPELVKSLETACIAARANPNAWVAARTELVEPSGIPLDSAASADIAILRRIVAIPHAEARADSGGRFTFIGVPSGAFWIEAEMVQGSGIVQWWHHLSMEPVDLAFARLFGQKTTKLPIKLVTQELTHDQFCTGGEQPMGAAEFAVGRKTHVMSSTPSESAYVTVDQPAVPLDKYSLSPDYPAELRKQAVEGSVTARFVIDTTGAVDMRTLRIISSTDFRFTNAVRDRLSLARFQPARIDGRPVRWVAEQQFVFSLR